jgi:hypothetical protein
VGFVATKTGGSPSVLKRRIFGRDKFDTVHRDCQKKKKDCQKTAPNPVLDEEARKPD